MPETVEFGGETFKVADRIGSMPLMRFAKVAQSGVDAEGMAGLAAMYDLLQNSIASEDWARFERTADRIRARGHELMSVVYEVMAMVTDRPTSRPSDSSDGPLTTEPKSADDSSSRVMTRLSGRPDLQLMVLQAQEARAS